MYKFLFVSLLLLGLAGTAQAQMSDQQVVDYVKNGISAGKDKNQIGRELVVRRVTQSQLERLKVQYEGEDRRCRHGRCDGRVAATEKPGGR